MTGDRDRADRPPGRQDVTAARNFLQFLQEQADRDGEEELDDDELDDLWRAAEIALVVIHEGDIGYRRAEKLASQDPRHEGAAPGTPVNFKTAARYAGPVIASLQAVLDEWSTGDTGARLTRRSSITIRLADRRSPGPPDK